MFFFSQYDNPKPSVWQSIELSYHSWIVIPKFYRVLRQFFFVFDCHSQFCFVNLSYSLSILSLSLSSTSLSLSILSLSLSSHRSPLLQNLQARVFTQLFQLLFDIYTYTIVYISNPCKIFLKLNPSLLKNFEFCVYC